MEELYELRVLEKHAHMLFLPSEGRKNGSVRVVIISKDDPRFPRIGELDLEMQSTVGTSFFYGWKIYRKYSRTELNAASLFSFEVAGAFEPCGEECGTIYDESRACPKCGSGAELVGPLVLNVSRIPKKRQISWTIAEEIVICKDLKEAIEREGLTGARMDPVRSHKKGHALSEEWFRLAAETATTHVVPPTLVGDGPFELDLEGENKCARGDLLGLNLLSELTVAKESVAELDFQWTKQFVGVQRGLLRPRRIMLVSPRVHKLFEREKVKGSEFEIAHVV